MTLTEAKDCIEAMLIDSPFPEPAPYKVVRTKKHEPCGRISFDTYDYMAFLGKDGKLHYWKWDINIDEDSGAEYLDQDLDNDQLINSSYWDFTAWCVDAPPYNIGRWICEECRDE